ncbi:hypothetical protein [Listeria sp. PSOL-1]|uniref:hypothetical protein n=1 Tax=Listeria sp. PSOL-1 TaxID=1844999 RepID=UPI0013D5CE6B|nr:hypothetical protein [Listeria sp. PSOL-1]
MDKSIRSFLFFSCCLVIAFLVALNLLVFDKGHWSIYLSILLLSPAYFFLFGKKYFKSHAVFSSLFVLTALTLVNYFESPIYAWVVFAIPAVCAWPAVIIGGKKSGESGYAFLISTMLALSYIGLNLSFETRFPFSIFTTFVIYWWPLAVTFARFLRIFSVVGTIWTTLFFMVTNLVTTDTIWWIYPVFALLFWPLSLFFARYLFAYSILATLLLSIFFITVNVITTPHVIWAIYPIFGILFWPLAMYFFVYRRRGVRRLFS